MVALRHLVLLQLCLITPVSAAQGGFALRETESIPLPSDLVPTGASVVGSGDFAVWSAVSGEIVLSLRRSIRADTAIGEPLFVTRTLSGFAVYDGRSNSIVTFAESGRLLSTRGVSLPGRALAASHVGGDWYVWVQSRTDLRSLYRVPASASPLHLATTPYGHPIHLAQAPLGTVTTEIFLPYTSVVRDTEGAEVRRYTPPGDTLELFDEDSRIVSSPLLLGDALILQTLADLRSDRRVVLVYSPSGTLRSATPLDLPLAFFGISREGSFLFAMRSVQGRDIATYSVELQNDR